LNKFHKTVKYFINIDLNINKDKKGKLTPSISLSAAGKKSIG
jgi:hypothetical protein